MQKVFISHSSNDKISYVNKVAEKLIIELGHENVILDEITFEAGRKTVEEIEACLNTTGLFVFFISETSLNSDWVREELCKTEALWKNNLLQVCPLIIDSSITHNDVRIPKWMRDNYNIIYISRPLKSARIIIQRMIELSYENHPKLKERNEIFVGRNEFINSFEERMDDFDKEKPICVLASGIKSIGRTKLLQKCIYKSNIRKETNNFPLISLRDNESIEDFILKNMIWV